MNPAELEKLKAIKTLPSLIKYLQDGLEWPIRRILGPLVIKRRANAQKAKQAFWHQHDLVFISSCGEEHDRAVTKVSGPSKKARQTALPLPPAADEFPIK